jgi:hypothetical protein
MKTFGCIALLALALGVAANPVQLENRAAATLTTPAPEPTCSVDRKEFSYVKQHTNYKSLLLVISEGYRPTDILGLQVCLNLCSKV